MRKALANAHDNKDEHVIKRSFPNAPSTGKKIAPGCGHGTIVTPSGDLVEGKHQAAWPYELWNRMDEVKMSQFRRPYVKKQGHHPNRTSFDAWVYWDQDRWNVLPFKKATLDDDILILMQSWKKEEQPHLIPPLKGVDGNEGTHDR
jgi:hypothetical protein